MSQRERLAAGFFGFAVAFGKVGDDRVAVIAL
jgi:hypothetical protein